MVASLIASKSIQNKNNNLSHENINNPWVNLGAYGRVELIKNKESFFIRTRTSFYKVPTEINQQEIESWTLKAIKNDWIKTPLYPAKIPNTSHTEKINSSNQHLYHQGKFDWINIERGRLKIGKNDKGEIIAKTRKKSYIVPKNISSSPSKVKTWLTSKKIESHELYPKKIIPETDVSKIFIGRQNGYGSSASSDFKPLTSERWLDTKLGQVSLGASESSPKRLMIKTRGEGYYYVPNEYSKSRVAIKEWVENAVNEGSITTSLYSYPTQTKPLNINQEVGKDIAFYYNTIKNIVDDEYNHSLTSPERPPKGNTGDVTLRVQPWRGKPIWNLFDPKEQLIECKLISTAGRPGCDFKTKWVISEEFKGLQEILNVINAKIEFESSGAVRFVNGQIIGQGAAAIKLNISHPQPESLIRLVVGLEFPQFSAPMMPIIQRVLPNLASLYQLLTKPPQDRSEFVRKFDDIAGQILIPITMLGGQISLVYPANNAIKKALSTSSSISAASGFEPLAALLKAAEGSLSVLEKATGFNIRIGYTQTLRDPLVKSSSGHFVADNSRHVLLVGKNTEGKIITAQRIEFARNLFGDRFLDPTLSEYATALFERGFNAFQVSTLIPLRSARLATEKFASDPEKAFLSPPPFAPQRLKYDKVMQIADQAAQAIIDIRSRLPANTLREVPRILNSYDESVLALQKSLHIIRSYGSKNQPTPLEKRFLFNLANPYGIDWGIPEVRQLNQKNYNIMKPDQELTEKIISNNTPKYHIDGGFDDRPEIITKNNDQSRKKFVFSIWNDAFNHKNKEQRRHVGLVNPENQIGLKKSLDRFLR